jgi:DNA-binding NarL/FixJ family response regulator
MRVLLADDQELFREGVRLILETADDFSVVGEAADGFEAVRQARLLEPDVLLMDIRMPRLDGLEARRILAECSQARVIVLTTFDLDEYVYAAMKAGASGFLLKDLRRDQLIGAIRTAAAGDALLAPAVTRRLVERFCGEPPPADGLPESMAELTARELEVLKLVARGLSNRQIGEALFLSEATVKPTSRTSTPSSACATASKPSYLPTRPGSSTPGTRRPVSGTLQPATAHVGRCAAPRSLPLPRAPASLLASRRRVTAFSRMQERDEPRSRPGHARSSSNSTVGSSWSRARTVRGRAAPRSGKRSCRRAARAHSRWSTICGRDERPRLRFRIA